MANLASTDFVLGQPKNPYRFLGRGVYSLAEARRYADLPASTARAWFLGRADGKGRGAILTSDYQRVDSDFAISFLDLIELFVTGRFRAFGIPMKSVRAAHAVLRDELSVPHPFAHSELSVHGKKVIRRIAGELGGKVFYEVTTGQLFFRDLEAGLERIDYVAGLAARWRIGDGVLIDPTVAFGKPTVRGAGTTTTVIAQQYWANGANAAVVADLFDLSEQDVKSAVGFEEMIGRAA